MRLRLFSIADSQFEEIYKSESEKKTNVLESTCNAISELQDSNYDESAHKNMPDDLSNRPYISLNS